MKNVLTEAQAHMQTVHFQGTTAVYIVNLCPFSRIFCIYTDFFLLFLFFLEFFLLSSARSIVSLWVLMLLLCHCCEEKAEICTGKLVACRNAFGDLAMVFRSESISAVHMHSTYSLGRERKLYDVNKITQM